MINTLGRCGLCGQEMHPTDYLQRLRDELAAALKALESRNCDDLCIEHINRAEIVTQLLREARQEVVDQCEYNDLMPDYVAEMIKRIDEALAPSKREET